MSEARTWQGPSAPERLALLRRTRSVAIVGASDNPSRASYFVATYLLSSSPFDVYLVNPRASTILGRPVYPSLADLPVVPDLVDVFRRHDDLRHGCPLGGRAGLGGEAGGAADPVLAPIPACRSNGGNGQRADQSLVHDLILCPPAPALRRHLSLIHI